MSIFNMIYGSSSGGGGDASLNFSIVAQADQPSSPSENMIWMETSTPMPSWSMSPTAPAYPEAGDVWISTSVSSAVAFNAVADGVNELMVYPIDARQYADDKWQKLNAEIYQSGEWVVFSTEGPTPDLEVIKDGVLLDGYTLEGFTQEDGYIKLYAANGGASNDGFLLPALSVSGFSSIKFDAKVTGGATAKYYIGLKENSTDVGDATFVHSVSANYTSGTDVAISQEIELDGTHDELYFAAYTKSGSQMATTIKIINLTLCL